MAILGAMAATGYQENIEWKFGRLGSCRRVCRGWSERWGMICSLRGVGLFILELSCILALSVKAAVQHPVSDFRLGEQVRGKSVYLMIIPSILTQHHVIITNLPFIIR